MNIQRHLWRHILEGCNVTQQKGGPEYSWGVMNINEGWRWIFMRGDEY